MLPPAKARIRVLESVPIMSRPTRMPARNRSAREMSGDWPWISAMALAMDMPTSIMAPRAEISRPENSSPPTWMPEVLHRVIRLSMSLTFQPVTPVEKEKREANTPAITTPATVPAVATKVLRVGPPSSHMDTTVVTAHTSTALQKGDQPRYTMGRYTQMMQAKVNTRLSAPLAPCHPPMAHRASRYSATKQMI